MFKTCNKMSRIKINCVKNMFTTLNSSHSDILFYSSFNLQHLVFKSYSTESSKKVDIAIVGAGIVGVSTAMELKARLPDMSVCVIEKESTVAAHQSRRNSGVIHAGIYYTPGSLKAKLCVEGLTLMYDYLEKHKIPYKRNGKLLIAVNKQEVKWLKDLFVRGNENKAPGLELLDPQQFKEIEPHMVGLKAIYSPYTGIVEFGDVALHFANQFRLLGGSTLMNFKVINIVENREGDGTTKSDSSAYPITIVAEDGRTVNAGFVLTCGGLFSDNLAQLTGESPIPKIIPFRGQYFVLNPEKNSMIKGNVYPVPDPSLPFIGAHFTPKIDGSVWLGPTAMIAFKKEGYSWTDIDFRHMIDMVKFKGMRKFFFKHPGGCIYELLRSASKSVILKELQLYMPTLKLSDIQDGAVPGVQALGMNPDGSVLGDFVFADVKGRVLHCRNTPTPGATSSLAIGKHLADTIQKHL